LPPNEGPRGSATGGGRDRDAYRPLSLVASWVGRT
jgi:hypothetical protein